MSKQIPSCPVHISHKKILYIPLAHVDRVCKDLNLPCVSPALVIVAYMKPLDTKHPVIILLQRKNRNDNIN